VVVILVVAAVLVAMPAVHGLGHYLAAGRPGRLAHVAIPFHGCVGRGVLDELSRRRRLAALLGGIGAHYLGLAALAFGLYLWWGTPTGASHVVVDHIREDSDAYGKLDPGDRLLAIDGQDLTYGLQPMRELGAFVRASRGRPVSIVAERDGTSRTVVVTPAPDDAMEYRLGVVFHYQPDREAGAGAAAVAGLVDPGRRAAWAARALWRVVAGGERFELGGPVAIVAVTEAPAPGLAVAAGWALVLGVYEGILFLLVDLVLFALGLRRASARR